MKSLLLALVALALLVTPSIPQAIDGLYVGAGAGSNAFDDDEKELCMCFRRVTYR